MAGNFTFPTEAVSRFIVADLVNVTWNVIAPLVSLYESCGSTDRTLEDKKSNNGSYVWIATREDYVESGCNFKLQPFTAEGESYGNNVTSVLFGVSKRYTSDPSPVSYNFVDESSMTASPTIAATTSLPQSTTTTTLPTAAETTSNTSDVLSHTSKVGIGLGVPLGLILIAAAVGAFILFKRKRRHKRNQGMSVTDHSGRDDLDPLPIIGHQDPRHARISQTETVTSLSQLSSGNGHLTGTDKRLSELMSTERVEIG